MLPVTRRLPGVRRLVDRQSYFILHSPRQVGKTDRSHSSSPFNIKDASLTLRNFTADEVRELYAQHAADTGQQFTREATDRAYELTEGQPWLVNALAREAVDELVPDTS